MSEVIDNEQILKVDQGHHKVFDINALTIMIINQKETDVFTDSDVLHRIVD